MSIRIRRRLTLAGILAVTALAPAGAAQADEVSASRIDCDARYERLLDRFHAIEERRGWDEAAEWWNEHGWPRFYDRCLRPA
jgi:hypothetical protein